MVWRTLGLAAALLFAPGIFAQRGKWSADSYPAIDCGPYLQSGSCTSVVVRWRTIWPTSSVVRFGPGPDRLDRAATENNKSTDHVIVLGGLEPNTQYYYAIGRNDRTSPRDRAFQFQTAPLPGSRQPIRVWVLGDAGTGSATQRAVRDAYYRANTTNRTDLILALGDNAYGRGSQQQYESRFFDVYRELFRHTTLWPTLGNHDAKSAQSATESGVYYSVFTLPRLGQCGGVPSGTAAYYSFDYGNAHFICLNSEDVDLTPQAPMLSWLKRDLEVSGREWTICYWHQCPYTAGTHDSDSTLPKDLHMSLMREEVLPVLESAGVDLVLCGHTHVYERSFLLHGHYGTSQTLQRGMILDHGDGRPDGDGPYRKNPNGPGTVYVNTGSAGHATPRRQLHGLNYPAMCVSLNLPGSVLLEMNGPRLDCSFLDAQGLQRDWFEMRKAP